MGRFRKLAVGATAMAATLTVGATAPASAHTSVRLLATVMTGAQEAPGPGDADAVGFAAFVVKPKQGRICYVLSAANIVTPTAAHIHRAPVGSPGAVVVPLKPPVRGVSADCAEVDPALAQEIGNNPSAFYVNVHNADFPAGALRGQLHDKH